ncbi:MAG: rhodanese-like domain-containing protein [Acidimicrobiales bacterium]|jgi:rhodanese-related sulfurtransferase
MDQLEAVEQIGPDDAARLLAEGAALIDVREPEEWEIGRAPEAVHIPLGELGVRLNELPADRKLIMVCRSGIRSGTAAAALVERGLPALNLAGGMQAWKAAAFPVVADGGVPGEVA